MAWTVLFYEKPSGKKSIEEFLDSLPEKPRAKVLSYLAAFQDNGFKLPSNYLKKVDDNIWSLRPEYGNQEYRLLFCRTDKETIVVLHAIHKKTQRLASKDWDLAKQRRDEVTAK